MTILKPYPAYKDSGVDWLGELPKHWSMTRLRNCVEDSVAGFWGEEPTSDNEIDHVWCVRVADFDMRRLRISQKRKTLRAVPYSARRPRLLRHGDLLLEKSGGGDNQPVGRVVMFDWDEPAITSNFVTRLRPDTYSVEPRFLLLMMETMQATRITHLSIKQTTGIQNLDERNYLSNSIPLPPLDEQRAIADFLDGMDARITRFIAARRKMISLLEEKKQAVINQAVTRGLDPSVPMKDSGVDWLGEIPAHWTIAKIRHVAALESGHTPDRTITDYWLPSNDIPWVSLKDTATLKRVDYISETSNYVNELGLANSSARLLPARSVVFTRDATIGKAAITVRPMAVSQHLIAWVPGPDLHAEYLLHTLYAMEPHLDQLTFGATIRTIGMDDVRTMTMPIPPHEEQVGIAQHLFAERSRMEELISRHRREIELIQEYRTRLISDVVTGKLDVRGVKLPAVEEVIGKEIEAAGDPEQVVNSITEYPEQL